MTVGAWLRQSFDNVHACGRVEGSMTQQTPFDPCSRKGEVRARMATTLLDEVRSGNLRAMIVRSADFHGPRAVQSLPQRRATVFTRLKAGRTPQWLGNPCAVHPFTCTPDAGRTLALLGQSAQAYGQAGTRRPRTSH